MKQAAASNTGAVTHQSLERGLRVMEVIAARGRFTSLAEISRRTGLHRSTAHHLLQTLVSIGYLRQDAATRGYEISAKLFKLTGRSWTPEQLAAIGDPVVAELARVTSEGASLSVYHDGVVTVVAKCDHDGPVRVVQALGAERPIHASAVGKAIVAFLPRPELAGVLARLTFERYTPKTLVTLDAFEAELRRVRATGVAVDDEEHIEGVRCLAAPFFTYTGHVAGCLCSVGPSSRISRQRLRELRDPLCNSARTLSERLGWTPPNAAPRRTG